MSMIPDEVIEQVRDSADLVAIIGEIGGSQAHRRRLPRALSLPRRPAPELRRHPEEGPLLLLRLQGIGRRLLLVHEAVRHGLSHGGARSGAQAGDRRFRRPASRQGPDPREPLFQAVAVAHDWFARQLREAPEAEDARRVSRRAGASTSKPSAPFELGYAPRGAGLRRRRWPSSGSSEASCSRPASWPGARTARVDPAVPGPAALSDPRPARARGRLRRAPARPRRAQVPQLARDRRSSTRARTLYNLHAARNAIRKEGRGHPGRGLLRRAPAGAGRHRARGGAARHRAHRRPGRRCSGAIAPQAILLLDSDMAGLKATFRAGDELLRHEVRVRVATMPAGRGSRYPGAEGRAGGARAGPARRGRRDGAEDPDPRAEGLVRAASSTGGRRWTGCCRPFGPPGTRSSGSCTCAGGGADRRGQGGAGAGGGGPADCPPGPPTTGGPGAARPGATQGAGPPRRRRCAAAGRAPSQLLRLLVASDEWRRRAPRGAAAGVVRGRPATGSCSTRCCATSDPGLGGAAGGAVAAARGRCGAGGGNRCPDSICRAGQSLRRRLAPARGAPALRAWRQLNERIRAADAAEQVALLAEKDRRTRELQQKYPDEFRTYGFQLGRRQRSPARAARQTGSPIAPITQWPSSPRTHDASRSGEAARTAGQGPGTCSRPTRRSTPSSPRSRRSTSSWRTREQAVAQAARAVADAGTPAAGARGQDRELPEAARTGARRASSRCADPKEMQAVMAELDLARSVLAKEEADWVKLADLIAGLEAAGKEAEQPAGADARGAAGGARRAGSPAGRRPRRAGTRR